jgi:hypothetical protein
LRNPAVDGAIVGFRHPDQVDPILAPSSATRTSTTSKTENSDEADMLIDMNTLLNRARP